MPIVPSKTEDEHVWKEELKLRMQKLQEEQRKTAEEEKKRLKELHWMHCPKCGQKLAAEGYSNVEIDVCPSCKGVWLDAGELKTIIEASKNTVFRSWLKTVRDSLHG